MIRVPCVAIVIENRQKEILLLLRDIDPTIFYPDHWTLVGGKVEEGETPEAAAASRPAERYRARPIVRENVDRSREWLGTIARA